MKRILQILFVAVLMVHSSFSQTTPGEALPPRVVLVLGIDGKLQVSPDGGKEFRRARKGETYGERAVFRMKGSGHADLFFRRIGTMVRLMSNSEMAVDKLQWRYNQDGIIVKDTFLDLRKGRLFAFVRVLFPESKFQIRAGQKVGSVTGVGTGRYEVRSDGRFVAGRSSKSSLRVIVDGTERLVDPGHVLSLREAKVVPLDPSEDELNVIELDELERLAQFLTPPPTSAELPKK